MDAREEEAYDDGHIPGAMNVPYDKLPKYYGTITSTIAKDQIIVCYCWGPNCDFSDNLASELAMMGYKNVVVFRGGWDEWQEAGYPIERIKTQSN
jgi:rhodanese-related sulfurtransferase